jgi:hypothetical protein
MPIIFAQAIMFMFQAAVADYCQMHRNLWLL